MASSITRNWVGGLSSGLDTQGLIDKFMSIERVPVDRLGQKKTTLSFQKQLLQEVNLKLFDLQSKSTDLTFARTFNSKAVVSTGERNLTAVASTDAKVGSYTIQIKQLASSTKALSSGKLAEPEERGIYAPSSQTIGGSSTSLSAIGITSGDLTFAISGGATTTLALGLGPSSSISDLVRNTNSKISANSDLKGKIVASYNESQNKLQFSLVDTTKTITISDSGGGNIIAGMIDGSGSSVLNKNNPSRFSSQTLRTGLQATMDDLSISTLGGLTLQRTAGPVENLSLAGLTGASTVDEMVRELNHQVDLKSSLVKGGTITGNPDDRLVEFRYDQTSKKIVLTNTNVADAVGFTLADNGGDMVSKTFGAGTVGITNDPGKALSLETFSQTISSGIFTVDGVQINVNTGSDTLRDVLSRITSQTALDASYDSSTDRIKLARKDGSTTPIGLGSATDTSNFLNVTALISGSQSGPAAKTSNGTMGTLTASDAHTVAMNALPGGALDVPVAGNGSLRVTVNGTATDISYQATDTFSSVLDKIGRINGVSKAYYDASTQKVTIETSAKGTGASLKIEDVSGNFAAAAKIDTTAATGATFGTSVESSRPISDISSTVNLANAGFAKAITAGSFTINGVNFAISNPSSVTLKTLMDTINANAKVGVKAEFDSLNGQLVLTSKQTGNTAISIGAPSDTSNFLSAVGLLATEQQVGKNAIFNVKGLFGDADLVRQSNEVSDVVSGLTLSLKGVTDGNGETVSVSADTTNSRKAIDDFIKSYNETMDLVYKRLTEKRDYTIEALTDTKKSSMSKDEIASYEADYKIGLLSGDTTLSNARSRMRVIMSSSVSGIDKTMKALADIGITTGQIGSGYQDTQVGQLKITSEDKLNNALKNTPEKVADLFAKDSTTDSGKGIARRLKDTLNEFTKSDGLLTKRVGRSGVTSANSEFDKQIKLVNDQIGNQERRLIAKEEALIKQFSDLENAMSKYQSQSTAFQQQLAKMSGGG